MSCRRRLYASNMSKHQAIRCSNAKCVNGSCANIRCRHTHITSITVFYTIATKVSTLLLLIDFISQFQHARKTQTQTAYTGYRSVLLTSPGLAFDLGWKATALIVATLWYFGHMRATPVYLLDFAVFEPPASWRVTHEQLIEVRTCTLIIHIVIQVHMMYM
jgi:hypothetical protein